MKPITETCTPRPDVLAGGLDDRDFAAQLDKVVTDDANYRVYTDAATFFDLTFPTSGLRELIAATFGHLTGAGGSSILRAQTSFGGGKTHSLIALYHLASGFRPDNLHEFVDDAVVLPDEPVRIAAVVGDALDPTSGTTSSGRKTYTLWGEIASQLGDDSWAAIAEHDAARTAPGTGAIRRMLDGGPAIIVLDELAQHLAHCTGAGDERVRRQATQVAPFLKNLSEEVDGRDDVVVVITLASQSDAFADATAELERTFADIGAVLARKGRDVQPATESEIAEILKRRLFESIDHEAAAEASSAYRELYAGVGEQVGVTGKVGADTADQLAVTYPFHPELVRLLDKRIGTIPKFQRTRGALRLLSRVVAAVWNGGDGPVVLNVADLPLGTPGVRHELTDRIDRHKFAEVITADVAGDIPFAARVDHDRYQDRPVATRAATTVLAHSLEETAEAGSPLAEVAIGTLRPGDDPALVEDALGRLHAVAWHLAYDNVRWRFQTAPNANRIVSSEADRVMPSKVTEERNVLLARMCQSTGTIETHVGPADLESVPDDKKVNLAVPHHDTVAVTAKTADTAPALLQQARAKGPSGKPRRHRNGICYLVADADLVAEMDQAVRVMIAAQAIVADDGRMQSYNETVQQQLRDIADASHLKAHVAVGRCYRHLYHPAANKGHGDLVHVALPADVQGTIGERPQKGTLAPGKRWTDRVWQTLVDMEKVRPSDKALATNWLRSKAWPKTADRIRTVDMLDVFWTDHSADLLADESPVVRGIQAGIVNGDWVMQDLRGATDARGKVHSNRSATSTPPPVPFNDNVWLVDYQIAVDEGLLATPTTGGDVTKLVGKLEAGQTLTGPQIREALEKAKHGHEPSKQEVRAALADAIRTGTVVVERDGDKVTPGELTGDKVGFDQLTVRPATEGEDDSTKPVVPKRRTFTGSAGPECEKLVGWVADQIQAGHTDGLVELAATVEVTDDSPDAAKTLITMLGSLPDLADVTFAADITYGIDGVDGEMTVTIDHADRRQAQQQVKAVLAAAGEKAGAPIEGHATVVFTLAEPHAPDAPKVAGLIKTLTTYFTGPVELKGRVA
jgi:hypothetical protein